MHIDTIYQNVLTQILSEKAYQYQTPKYAGLTTGMRVYPDTSGVNFGLEISKSFPLITLRKLPIKIFIAEMIWYLNGSKDPKWLQKYTKIWDDFRDDDGLVSSSYGYRWRYHFGRDQVAEAIQVLTKDPSNRQAVITTWDPTKDGLDSKRQKNVPCIPMFQFFILDGQLNLHVFWRSNDMYLGFPHDVAGFALLLAIIAQKMDLPIGTLRYSISHAHIYENQVEACQKLLQVKSLEKNIHLDLPKKTFEIARDGTELERDKLVKHIFENLINQYQALQTLSRVKIVV